jgi:hypothetical protein
MTFKSTIETLSEVSIDSSDACPAARFHLLSEAELDRVTGGRIKMEGPERPRDPNSGGGGDLIDNRWSQHPVYLGPF